MEGDAALHSVWLFSLSTTTTTTFQRQLFSTLRFLVQFSTKTPGMLGKRRKKEFPIARVVGI